MGKGSGEIRIGGQRTGIRSLKEGQDLTRNIAGHLYAMVVVACCARHLRE